jgi:polyferredoxin
MSRAERRRTKSGRNRGKARPKRSAVERRPPESRLLRAARYLAALFFVLHGAAHGAGVAEIFGSPPANESTFVTGLDPSSLVFRLLGAMWILALVLFLVAAFALATRRDWWKTATFVAAFVSLVLSLLWLQAAWVGVVVNAAILLGLLVVVLVERRRG